jgi:ABC-type sugar transport system ATPase subunit
MGSGRTELAMAIFGVNSIDGGKIYVHGQSYDINSPRRAMELGLGYLPEDRQLQGLVLKLSLAKNISLTDLEQISFKGVINYHAEHKLAEKAIKDLHIKTTGVNQKVRYLSGGNQQKVVIGKWLACQTDIFILDEPTRGIDVAAKVEIYHLMNALADQGTTIIMISSELPEVIGMCDRIMVMREGCIRGIFESNEVSQEELLKCELGVE